MTPIVPDPVVKAMTALMRYVAANRLSLPRTILLTGLATVSMMSVFLRIAPIVKANITSKAIFTMLSMPPRLQIAVVAAQVAWALQQVRDLSILLRVPTRPQEQGLPHCSWGQYPHKRPTKRRLQKAE